VVRVVRHGRLCSGSWNSNLIPDVLPGCFNVPKPPTRPLGVELFVDYVLPAGFGGAQDRVQHQERGAREEARFSRARAVFFGDANQNLYYKDGIQELAGFDIDTGLPFLVSSSGRGAWAFGWEGAELGPRTSPVSDALLDVNQVRHRLELAPAGTPGDVVQVAHYLAVGDSDPNSALAPLHEANPQPLPGWDMSSSRLPARSATAPPARRSPGPRSRSPSRTGKGSGRSWTVFNRTNKASSAA